MPSDINEIMESQCRYWPDKKVKETHMLTLIPSHVDGKPLTLERLGELVKKPKMGHEARFRVWYPGGNEKVCAEKPYWALMTKDVIPGTRNKTYAEQCEKFIEGYKSPSLIEAAASILMAYVSAKEELYTRAPWTYTRCEEKYKDCDSQMAIGGAAGGGLDVHDYDRAFYHFGLAGVRKLVP